MEGRSIPGDSFPVTGREPSTFARSRRQQQEREPPSLAALPALRANALPTHLFAAW